MSEISHLRQLRKEKRIQLLAMASTSNVIKSTKTSSKPGKDFISVLIKLFTLSTFLLYIFFLYSFVFLIVLYTVPQKKMSNEQMRERLRKRYLRLNEVRYKRLQREKQEEARRNKLMAKIFCKKLQQKVLRGQVDLSQSVSVISNL